MSDDDQLQVELVAADRNVWSGQARMVSARTSEGDIGILRGHTPVLSLLVPSTVAIDPVDGDRVIAAVDDGFISVAADRVSILAEHAILAADIDVEEERRVLEEAEGVAEDDPKHARAQSTVRRAEARIAAAELVS